MVKEFKMAVTKTFLQLLTFSAFSSLLKDLKNVQASCMLPKTSFQKKTGIMEEHWAHEKGEQQSHHTENLKKDLFLCNT